MESFVESFVGSFVESFVGNSKTTIGSRMRPTTQNADPRGFT